MNLWRKPVLVFFSGRPILSLVAGLAAGISLYKESDLGAVAAVVAFVSLMLVTMAGFVADDIFDRDKDLLVYQPHHSNPLAMGLLSMREAQVACAAMLLLALTLCEVFLGWKAMGILALIGLAVVVYSPFTHVVGWSKNVYCGLLVISPFLFVTLVTGIAVSPVILATLFGFTVFRELAYDAADFDRDKDAGQTTLAHVMGRDRAFVTGCLGMLVCVGYSVSLFHEPLAILLMAGCLGVQLYATALAYKDREQALALTRYVFFGGIVALIRYI